MDYHICLQSHIKSAAANGGGGVKKLIAGRVAFLLWLCEFVTVYFPFPYSSAIDIAISCYLD